METDILKTYIEAKRREYYPKARPWPNGLGFEHRGWSWSYSEQDHKWYVTKTHNGRTVRGAGENPFDAYAHAKPVSA